MSKRMFATRKLVMVSLFIAMQIVLSRLVAPINLPYVKVSFTFVPMAMCSIMYGPLVGGLSAFLADYLGMMIMPTGSGGYFLGFGVTAFLSGAFYGLFTKKWGVKTQTITAAVLASRLIANLLINTYWISILMGQGYMATLPPRIVSTALMIPIEILMLKAMWQYIGHRLSVNYGDESLL